MSYFDDIDREMDYMKALEREFSDIFTSADDILHEEQKHLQKVFKQTKEYMQNEREKTDAYVPLTQKSKNICRNYKLSKQENQTLDYAYDNVECLIG